MKLILAVAHLLNNNMGLDAQPELETHAIIQ